MARPQRREAKLAHLIGNEARGLRRVKAVGSHGFRVEGSPHISSRRVLVVAASSTSFSARDFEVSLVIVCVSPFYLRGFFGYLPPTSGGFEAIANNVKFKFLSLAKREVYCRCARLRRYLCRVDWSKYGKEHNKILVFRRLREGRQAASLPSVEAPAWAFLYQFR